MSKKGKFKVGDVVELKTGSPAMTIDLIEKNKENGNLRVETRWFCYSSNQFRWEYFNNVTSLVHYQPKKANE